MHISHVRCRVLQNVTKLEAVLCNVRIVKGYRTKSLKDISRYLLLLILAGATLWLIYGFAVGDVFIIGTNVAAIVLMLTVYIMKKRYDDERRWTENISSA